MSPNCTTKVLHAIARACFIKSTQSKIMNHIFRIKNKLKQKYKYRAVLKFGFDFFKKHQPSKTHRTTMYDTRRG